MFLITNAIFLAFLITTTTASINCHRSTHCTCMMNNNEHMELEFTCGDYDNSTSIRIVGNENVEIQCGYHERPILPPEVQIGDVQSVQVSHCSVSENLTQVKKFKFFCDLNPINFLFLQLLTRLGIESVDVLTVENGNLPQITSDFLKNLENITELSLILNGIEHIEDDAFCQLPLLTQLDLTRNNINLTPNTFDCLQNLLVLGIPSNEITQLPEGVFKQLKKLRVLQLWGNRIKSLNPDVFQELTQLGSLELSSNGLESLPNGIFDSLSNLIKINLNYNKIKNPPADLFAATAKLQQIRWDANRGLQLYENLFGNLPKLESLSLSANGFAKLPESLFENSTNIKTINLSKNVLTTIPESLFVGLSQLKTLDLSHNQIQKLEKGSFASLRSVENLYLQNNNIFDLNKELFDDLVELRVLRLDYNQIVTLPNFIYQRNLQALNASHNRISFKENLLGVSPLNRCTDLEIVDLSYNEISTFEEDFMNILVKLKLLDLSFNNIERISVNLLQRVSTHEHRIILANNNITFVDFSSSEITARLQDRIDIISSNLYSTIVSISNNPIVCDCNAYDLWRYYNYKLDPGVPAMVTILKEDVHCDSTDYLIAELPPKYFTCDLVELMDDFKCPMNCSCRWIPFGREIVYDCANSGLNEIPEIRLPQKMIKFDTLEVDLKLNQLKRGPTQDDEGYENVTRLLLSYNLIERVDWVPPKLEVLFL